MNNSKCRIWVLATEFLCLVCQLQIPLQQDKWQLQGNIKKWGKKLDYMLVIADCKKYDLIKPFFYRCYTLDYWLWKYKTSRNLLIIHVYYSTTSNSLKGHNMSTCIDDQHAQINLTCHECAFKSTKSQKFTLLNTITKSYQ